MDYYYNTLKWKKAKKLKEKKQVKAQNWSFSTILQFYFLFVRLGKISDDIFKKILSVSKTSKKWGCTK